MYTVELKCRLDVESKTDVEKVIGKISDLFDECVVEKVYKERFEIQMKPLGFGKGYSYAVVDNEDKMQPFPFKYEGDATEVCDALNTLIK